MHRDASGNAVKGSSP